MERELWPAIYRRIMASADAVRQVNVTFQPHIIVLVFAWAALHDRPAGWACLPRNGRHRAAAGEPAVPRDAQSPAQVDRRRRPDAPSRGPAAGRDDPGDRPGDRRQAPARRRGQSRPRRPQRPWSRQDRQGLQAARDLGQGRGPRGLVGRAAERLRTKAAEALLGFGARPGWLSVGRRRIRRRAVYDAAGWPATSWRRGEDPTPGWAIGSRAGIGSGASNCRRASSAKRGTRRGGRSSVDSAMPPPSRAGWARCRPGSEGCGGSGVGHG